MATHRIDHSWNGGGASLSASVNKTTDGETNRGPIVLTEGQQDKEVTIAFLTAALKLFDLQPTGAVVVKTNSSGAPDDTFYVDGGAFMSWFKGSGIPNPFSADVTSLFLSDNGVANTTAIHAAVTDNGSPQTITTAITDPTGGPRLITATAGGTAGDIKDIAVTVVGTDAGGQIQTEVLPAFTLNTAGTVTGSLEFETVTSFTIPAHDGTGATTSLGVAANLNGEVTVQVRSLHDATP